MALGYCSEEPTGVTLSLAVKGLIELNELKEEKGKVRTAESCERSAKLKTSRDTLLHSPVPRFL